MSFRSKTLVASAAVALASMTAGAVAAALVISVEADSRAFARPTQSSTWSSPTQSARLTAYPSPERQPLAGHAIRAVTISHMAKVQQGSKDAYSTAPEEPACIPYWREMDEGPAGRHVLVTCPGAPTPPAPPPDPARFSRLALLPSLSELSSGIPIEHHVEKGTPGPTTALMAARDVDSSLSNEWAARAERRPDLDVDSRMLPVVNPLGWSVPLKSHSS
jgi:hypothetical protein